MKGGIVAGLSLAEFLQDEVFWADIEKSAGFVQKNTGKVSDLTEEDLERFYFSVVEGE